MSGYNAGQEIQPVGILGFQFFKDFVVSMDYQNKTRSVYDTRAFEHKGNAEIVPVSVTDGLAYLDAKVRLTNGKLIEARFHLDSGSGIAVILYFPFVDENRLLETLPNLIMGSIVGEGGEVRAGVCDC